MDDMRIDVLDYGFVALKNIQATFPNCDLDTAPAKSARISFDVFAENRSKELDMRLVEYLIKYKHNTPIEMTETWWEMKLPIFIARQFVRHRTSCINEVSARYTQLPEEWYIPNVVGGKPLEGAKQGQSQNLSEKKQSAFRYNLNKQCCESYKLYREAIDNGIAPEHARLFLHLNHYTHWVWKQDLHNLMHFLSLRLDSHAQVEARAYANAMYSLLCRVIPETMKLFDTYRRNV